MERTKIIEISNLSKYIREINKLDNAVYFRGEKAKFSSRKSSALRPYEYRWNSKEPYPFMKMIDEFYKEIAYKLDDDKVDFIAFAQHHGIPTNLLDVTTSPLTALFFACQDVEEDEGIVYVANDSCIDVTELIHLYPNKNLLEHIFSNTTKELALLIPIFESYKKDYPADFKLLLHELIDSYLHYFSLPLCDNEKKFYNKLKRKKFDVWECIFYLREAEEEIKEFTLEQCDEDVYFYLALQFVFLKRARKFTEPIHAISFLPNMVYQPVMKFERGRNQQGLFLYQAYMTYIEPVYNFRVLTSQCMQFQNIEFHIKNKAEILRELDNIGINRKTLFCDYDNVAKYITEKYNLVKEENTLN